MTAANTSSTPQPIISGEEWRRTFAIAVNQRNGGAADLLPVADWAIQAQAQHGDRNPVEVAHEEWHGRPY